MAAGGNTGNKWESKEGQMSGAVFACIAHYIFMNMGTDELHIKFQTKPGTRIKRVGLFQHNLEETALHISRQRFDRILHRQDFHISQNDREKWERQFGVSMEDFYLGGGAPGAAVRV